MLAVVAVSIVLLGLAPAQGITESEWAMTIDQAGQQRTLSQSMSKEFLLVARGFEVPGNKAALAASIAEFDSVLNCLLSGCPSRSIIPPPTPLVRKGLEEVVAVWRPFMDMLQANVDNVRNVVTGAVNYVVLDRLAAENLPLLTKSDYVVSRLIDSAKADGASTGGLVFNIAGRQRTLIQQMCKYAYLVAMGVDVSNNLAHMRSTYYLFDESHRGIIDGASWAGIPMLTTKCALQQMREVSYQWEQFKPLVGQILAEPTAGKSRLMALTLTPNISNLSGSLFNSMVSAVDFYFNDTGVCTPLHISNSEWVFLLNNVGKQRTLGQQVTQLFMQIATGIDVQNSKVELTVKVKQTETHLRYLIEGSKANAIPSPPTQEITNQLILAYTVWNDLQELLLSAVDLEVIDDLLVRQVASLSQQHFDEMNAAVALYEDHCEVVERKVDAYLINLAGRQRTLYVKMSKEATLIKYGAEPASNWKMLNATKDLFLEVHWRLLLGEDPHSMRGHDHVLSRTTDRCLVQQMKTVAELFAELHQAALSVAWGSAAAIHKLITINTPAFDAMNTAVNWYANLPVVPTCAPLNVSYDEWLGAVTELGRLRALSQKASTYFLMVHYGNTPSDHTTLQSTIAELGTSVRNVEFGSGQDKVPAPFSQEMLDHMFTLETSWRAYEQMLKASTTGAVESGKVSQDGLALVGKAETAMDKYVVEALTHTHPSALKDGKRVPVHRVNVASRRTMLAYKMVKEALLARFTSAMSTGDMEGSIAAFDSASRQLKDGSADFPGIIPQRADLTSQWVLVNNMWQSFKGEVRHVSVVGDGNQDVYRLLQSLRRLQAELDVATALYAIHDPHVLPEEAKFPFTALAYGVLLVFLTAVICVACYTSTKLVSSGHKLGGRGADVGSVGGAMPV